MGVEVVDASAAQTRMPTPTDQPAATLEEDASAVHSVDFLKSLFALAL